MIKYEKQNYDAKSNSPNLYQRVANGVKKGVAVTALTVMLSGPAYAGNGGYITKNNVPEGYSTKDQTAAMTIDEQIKEYGAMGLLTGLLTWPLRAPLRTVCGVGRALTQSPQKTIEGIVKDIKKNPVEYIVTTAAGAAIINNCDGSGGAGGTEEWGGFD